MTQPPVPLPSQGDTDWMDWAAFVDSSARAIVISPAAPDAADKTPRLHVQTGLGPNGDGVTFWIEDGTP